MENNMENDIETNSDMYYKENWIEKYNPTRISDLISNRRIIKQIYDWLYTYNKNKRVILKLINEKSKKINRNSSFKSCMLLTGNHGVGKSVTIDVIAKQLNYDIKKLNVSIFKSEKNLGDIISKILMEDNIISMSNNNKKRKKIIIIDELESITSAIEKNAISNIQKLNDTKMYCPIIFISNDTHRKLIANIKKTAFWIKLYPPYDSEMIKLLNKISDSEKIIYKDNEIIYKIIHLVQGDVRRLLLILHDLKNAYNNSIITYEKITKYIESTKKKDIELNLYEATDNILYNYKSVNQCLRLYESNKVLLPLMVQQNYIPYILKNDNTNIELVHKVSDLLSYGDIIEYYIYSEQNWNLQDIHGIYTCSLPSHYLNDKISGIKININSEFAGDLHKTSIKNINRKNVTNSNKYFNHMTVSDYLYLNKIIKNFNSLNSSEISSILLNEYDIKIDSGIISTIMKIDKIDKSSSKTKPKE